MSRLVVHIVLSSLLPGVAVGIYVLLYPVLNTLLRWPDQMVFSLAGLITWGLLALIWILHWRPFVTWTVSRICWTALAFPLAAIGGIAVAWPLWPIERDIGAISGSAMAVFLWLVITTISWRDRPSGGHTNVLCPQCRYNLAGLTQAQCPECGWTGTLDALLAAQTHHQFAELEGSAHALHQDARHRQ